MCMISSLCIYDICVRGDIVDYRRFRMDLTVCPCVSLCVIVCHCARDVAMVFCLLVVLSLRDTEIRISIDERRLFEKNVIYVYIYNIYL